MVFLGSSFKISQMTEMAAGFLQLSVRPDKSSNYGIFAVCFKKVGDTASLYEFNGSATGSQIYAGIGLDEWVTVRIEMPLDEDKAVVTVIHGDNTEQFTSTSFWTDKVASGVDVKTLTPKYFRIFSPRDMDNLVYIDDVTAYTESSAKINKSSAVCKLWLADGAFLYINEDGVNYHAVRGVIST